MQGTGVIAAGGRQLGTLPPVFTVVGGPTGIDLIVTAISWTPATPVVGNQVIFSATVKNVGDTPTPAGIQLDVLFRVNGASTTWSDDHVTPLAPGASATLTANGGPAGIAYWLAQTGTFVIEAYVNSISRIDEGMNRGNNLLDVPLTVTGGGGGGPGSPGDVSTGIAASRIIAWVGIGEAFDSTAQIIDYATNRHIGGIVLVQNSIRGYGGSYAWTAAAAPTFNGGDGRTGSEWVFHKQLKQSSFIADCHAHGIKVYLGTKLVDLDNTTDGDFYPHDIWDAAYWNTYISSGLADGIGLYNFVRAAYNLGCDGIAFDPEPTPTNNGSQQTWKYSYLNNSHSQAATRAQVTAVWSQLGAMLWTAFPSADVVEYFPTSQMLRHTWEEDFNAVAAGDGGTYGNGIVQAANCVDEAVNGMFSAPGYGDFYLLDSLFYRNSFLGGPSGWQWPAAIRYSCLNLFARLSQQYSRPDLFLPKLRYAAFTWLDGDEVTGAGAMDSGTALYDLQWNNALSMRANAIYAQNWGNDYSAWYSALAAGASAAAPDSTLPTFPVLPNATGAGTTKTLLGTAAHLGYGIIYIEWILYENDGTTVVSAGMCSHQFIVGSKSYNVADGYTNGTYPFTATIPNGVSGRKITTIAHTPLGQQHSTTITL